jgi:hypothetical protein
MPGALLKVFNDEINKSTMANIEISGELSVAP